MQIGFPVATASIPRQIPPSPVYFSTPVVTAVGGILPFGCVFVELFFVLSSLWLDQYYYVFGFLLLVFILLAITCAEISIVLVYFQLCAENYNWWWRSALVPGASGVYLFLYSMFFFETRLSVDDWVVRRCCRCCCVTGAIDVWLFSVVCLADDGAVHRVHVSDCVLFCADDGDDGAPGDAVVFAQDLLRDQGGLMGIRAGWEEPRTGQCRV